MVLALSNEPNREGFTIFLIYLAAAALESLTLP